MIEEDPVQMADQILLSIVIPALNEEKTIGIVIEKALRTINKLGIKAELIVVDNGSTDNTSPISRKFGARVINVPARGYGNVLQHGFKAAEGKYILMADADDSYNLEEIEPFVDKLNDGYDLVIGNRRKGKFIRGASPFLHRYLGTPVLTFIINLLFKTDIGDVNCGMRAIRKEAYEKMQCKSLGMEFASEMIIKAALNKLKITEVPCTLYRSKRGRPPHLKTWSDGWRHLRLILSSFP